MVRVRAQRALWALVLCACQGPPSTALDAHDPKDADAGVPAECAPTLKPAGKACAPTLESCPGNQVPVPGGGCRRVGVEACDGGLRGPPDWTCRRVGPPTTCLTGWAMTKDGWCEPVLPQRDCPDGTMEVIGKTTCQPIGDCGTDTYGKIKPTADTVFVDHAYTGTASDGSQAKPFKTISAALKALPMDRKAHVAVAAGVYEEDVAIVNQPVVLEGRCAQQVTLQGSVSIEGSEAKLRNLTIRSPGVGVDVQGGMVELDRVAVVDCGNVGMSASHAATLSISDALIAGNHQHGILIDGVTLEIDRTVVRDTEPLAGADSPLGTGVAAVLNSHLTLRDSVVSGNHRNGIRVGSKARIERSVIRRTMPTYDRVGWGIAIADGAEVEVVDCVVADNTAAGVVVDGAQATLERTIVRDTLPPDSLNFSGEGITVGNSTHLLVRDSVVARNHSAGIFVGGASAIVDRTLVLDTLPRIAGTAGSGIEVWYYDYFEEPAASLTVTDSIVAGSRFTGIEIYGAEATLERTLVQHTLARELDGTFGFGVLALARIEPEAVLPATLRIQDSTITGSAFSGLALYGSEATVQTTVVRDTREPAPRRWGGPGMLVSSVGKAPSMLQMQDSLVADSSDFGIFLEGSHARLERTVLKDTRTRLGDNAGGYGVYAGPGKDGVSTELQLRDCQVAKSGIAGIYARDAPLDVQRCQVTSTSGDSEGYGDGIVVQGAQAKLLLLDSLVEHSLRCGLLALGASGLVDRSTLTRGAFSVVVENGAPLEIGPRVELLDNQEDRVTFGEYLATPPPPAVPPPPILEPSLPVP